MKLVKNFLKLSTFVLTVTVIGLVSCKDTTPADQQTEYDADEIVITASSPSLSANNVQSRITGLKETFESGDVIGLYSQLISEAGTQNVLQANSKYSHSLPIWLPNSVAEKLIYSDAGRIAIFGYYPHPDMTGSTTVVTGNNIAYSLPTAQNSDTDMSTADLLWSKADSAGVGYAKGELRAPITLPFRHALSRVSFSFKVIDSSPTTPYTGTVRLYKVQAFGRDIHTSATLNVLSGNLTTAAKTTFDSVTWQSPTKDEGIELTIGDATAVPVADMILIPFASTLEGSNTFKYSIFIESAGIDNHSGTTIPVYDATMPGTSSMLRFLSGEHSKIVVTIDLSNSKVTIATTIEPWTDGSTVEIPAERW